MTIQVNHSRSFWDLFGSPIPYGADATPPQSRKIGIFRKYKMAAGDHIVHLTKKNYKTKKFRINELVEEYLNFRGLRSKSEVLGPKN